MVGCVFMARYEHLPIYKQAMAIAVHFEKLVTGFSRYHKYTLGTELRQQSRGIVSLVIKANSQTDKAPFLLTLRDQLEQLLLLIRLAKEVQAFKSFKAWQYCIEQITGLCRQNEGWLKSCQPNTGGVSGDTGRVNYTRKPRAPRNKRNNNQ
jgi:hypothetical protein